MPRTRLYSHNPSSQGAKRLARGLRILRVKHTGSRFIPRPTDTVINWGSSSLPPELSRGRVLNSPARVGFVTNKLQFFRVASRHSRLPPFAITREEANELLTNGPICARQVLSGSGGAGIVFIENEEQMVDAPLYTKYIPKMSEFRVHIFQNEVIDVQRKARRRDVPDRNVNWHIRNLENGFIYARHDVVLPRDVSTQALAAFQWTGLDFGAVDVVWNQKKAEAYVLEINSAPGLEGTTLTNYVGAFRNLLYT